MIMTSARTATDVEAATRPSLDRLKENELSGRLSSFSMSGQSPLRNSVTYDLEKPASPLKALPCSHRLTAHEPIMSSLLWQNNDEQSSGKMLINRPVDSTSYMT